jgi:hypothetical protein
VRGTARIRVLALIVVALAVAGGGAFAVAGHGEGAAAAETATQAVTIARSALPSTARDVRGDPGGELLSVDLRGDGSAQVVLYDYAADRAHQITVAGGEVTADRAASGVQPPASGDEVADAFGIALRSPSPLPFARTFAEQQGVPLVSADQVHVDAEAWTPSDPDSAGDAGVCGVHRCLRLVVATAAGEYLDTTDFVVDLSMGRILHTTSGS